MKMDYFLNLKAKTLGLCFLCSSLLGLSACSTLLTREVSTSLAEDVSRLKYTGKGAGASAMLMSSMGPAGVAIGIAIDEGIGKDIHGAFVESGYDLHHFVSKSVDQELELLCSSSKAKQAALCSSSSLVFTFERVALKAMFGDSDRVVADLELSVSGAEIERLVSAKQASLCSDVSEELDLIKTDGSLTAGLISKCIGQIVEYLAD